MPVRPTSTDCVLLGPIRVELPDATVLLALEMARCARDAAARVAVEELVPCVEHARAAEVDGAWNAVHGISDEEEGGRFP